MTVQLLPSFVYLAILLIALLIPYLTWERPVMAAGRWTMVAIVGCATLLTAARHGGFLILSLLLLLPLLGLGVRALLGGIAAVLLFAPVNWWNPDLHMGPAMAGLFILLSLGAGYLPRLAVGPPAKTAQPAILVPMAFALVIGLAVGLLTAPFGSREPIHAAWHHWSAYLAPVEAWLGGGVPYRDFPIQYGMGPTAVLAAACGSGCWRGIYWTALLANAFYFSALAGCVVILTARRSHGVRWLALVALWSATFLWTATPNDVGSTVMMPSVAGLRFLPIALLLLQILSAESSGRRRDWLGHAIWLCDLFWSPEAAIFGTLIWWPYLALRNAAKAPTSRESWTALFRGALRGLMAFAGGATILALFLWLLSAGAARPSDFLAYILYPPGPLPVNPYGPIWLALAAILLALHALVGAGRSKQSRALYACLLGFLAAGTYFLSRSHDNNVLNLFPLLVILLIACVQTDSPGDGAPVFGEGFVRTALAAMVAFIVTFGWTSWTKGAATDGPFNLGPSRLIANFAPRPDTQPSILPPDELRGLAYLRDRDAGAVVLLDDKKLIPMHARGKAWTGVNNVANLEPLPRGLIERYVCRGAVAYRRPGWILVDQRNYGAWVRVFEAGYEVSEQAGFGAYQAYHLVPRPGPLPCAEL